MVSGKIWPFESRCLLCPIFASFFSYLLPLSLPKLPKLICFVFAKRIKTNQNVGVDSPSSVYVDEYEWVNQYAPTEADPSLRSVETDSSVLWVQ